jgi:hypothetical protein
VQVSFGSSAVTAKRSPGDMAIVTPIILLACALYLAFPIYNWIVSVRLLGLEAIAAIRLAIVLDRNRPRYLAQHKARPDAVAFAIGFVVLAAASAAVAIAIDWMLVLNLSIVLFTLGIGHFVLASQPPVILYLASSGSESERRQIQLFNAAQPYRLVALLRSAESITQSLTPLSNLTNPNLAERGAILGSDLRQTKWKSWQEAVANVMRVVRIIVIDDRNPTNCLYEENALIREFRLEYKTLRIANPEVGLQGGVTEEWLLKHICELARSRSDLRTGVNIRAVEGSGGTDSPSVADLLGDLDSAERAVSERAKCALVRMGESGVDAVIKSAHEINRRLLTGYQMDLVLKLLRRRIEVLGLIKSGRAVQMISAAVADSTELIHRQREIIAETKTKTKDPRPIWQMAERLSVAKRVQRSALKALVQIGDESDRQLSKHMDAFSQTAQQSLRQALRSIRLWRLLRRLLGK